MNIARRLIQELGNPDWTEDWDLKWEGDFERKGLFRKLVREHAEGMSDPVFDSYYRRLLRNFKKNQKMLLRRAHMGEELDFEAGEAAAAYLADHLDELGIRMGVPRRLRLGHKPPLIK